MNKERLNKIEYSEIYEYIKNGNLDNYLDQTERDTTIRHDIEFNGTRSVAVWVENNDTKNEKIVDICLDVKNGYPIYLERVDFDDNTIKLFDDFDKAIEVMEYDIINYEKLVVK